MIYIVVILVVALTIACIRINQLNEKKEQPVLIEDPQLNAVYWLYLDVVESQIQQLEIDRFTNFISEECYEARKKDILEKLAELKEEYLRDASSKKLDLAS